MNLSLDSSSESEEDEEEVSKVGPVASKVEIDTKFGANLEPDECEIVEGPDYIEIIMGLTFGMRSMTRSQ